MKGTSSVAVRLDVTSSSVAIAYKCTWLDNLWRFRWDVNGRTRRSELAFPGDHGFMTFHDAICAAVEIGFRAHNVVQDFRTKR